MNSKSATHPNGIGNSNGLVGKYLMDTVGADGSTGFFESMMDLPPHDDDGLGGFHLYMPWWNYQKQAKTSCPLLAGITSRWAAAVTCRRWECSAHRTSFWAVATA